MMAFRNSIAASCSNLKRSRTELLASTSSATCSGRSVWLLKLRILVTCFVSSRIRMSSLFRSLMKWPCLSVAVKTMLTSLTRVMIVEAGSKSSGGASCWVPAVPEGTELEGVCVAAGGGSVTGTAAGAADGAVVAGGGGACFLGIATAEGAEGNSVCVCPTAHEVTAQSRNAAHNLLQRR